jgi:phosphate-selective porin
MDKLTSANQMTFIERAVATSAFTVSEVIGAGAIVHDKNWFFSAGLFNDDAGRSSTDDEALYAVTPDDDPNIILLRTQLSF